MTSKEEQAIIKALKALKDTPEGGYPDFETSERMSRRVMEYVMTHGGTFPRPFYYLGFFAILRAIQYLVSPRFAYGLAGFLLMVGAVGAATAAHDALPGETLYGAKIAVEKTQVRLTSNPASRARVQMELAGNRLKELQEIAKSAPRSGNGRVDEALNRFAKDVEDAANTLKQAGDPQQIKVATSDLAQKAEEYKEGLAELEKILKGEEGEEGEGEAGVVLPERKGAPRVVKFASLDKAEKALENMEKAAEDEVEDEELEEGEVGI